MSSVSPRPVEQTTPARVLVAEDNVVNQRLIKRMLEKLGCRVDLAANGGEAIAMAKAMTKELRYDLVLLDCVAPERDGYEATAQLRHHQGGRHVPIVALTGPLTPEDRTRSLAAGMDDHLAKPVNPDQLRAIVQRWIRLPSA